jgi:glutathione synthase/RimK-type ligase-like ATP-grasp enzyme
MEGKEKAGQAHFVVIGNLGNRRIEFFQKGLAALRLPAAQVISYSDLLKGVTHLSAHVVEGSIVRLESPERDFELEKALLMLGSETDDTEGYYARISRQAIANLEMDKGLIVFPRQWYLGYHELLKQIKQQLAVCPTHILMNCPDAIALMFDKPACHALLQSKGLSVPPSLPLVNSYAELREQLRQHHWYRVFVKLAHGSSASGVVAYQTNGLHEQATTTVEMVTDSAGKVKLYNSRRLHTYRNSHEIATLIDALCQHRVQVERWIPKAGLDNQILDLRVVVIAGQVQHVVVRLSATTVTNLHLSNKRAGLEILAGRLDPKNWQAARQTCEQVMVQAFPDSLYAGIDLLIASDYKHHAIAEVNAFGDLLYDTWYNKRDTYTAEIEAALLIAQAETPEIMYKK